ncbi:MAG: methionyl-tRNA formyltransferase [Bacteroidota bacterium]|nr:methionyl-tRNA formyltransferase [Bacteroidota bacterium]
MKRDLRIAYMGTPDFAVPALRKLAESKYRICAVVSAPDRPAGRGRKMKQSPVKEYALQQGLKVLQPANLKDPEFAGELKKLGINLIVVVAFRMLPASVWKLPEYGTFNLHASLLPQYRGAAPINWAIIRGEKKTGLTTFFIDDKIDTGRIILQEEVIIRETDHAGDLHDRLMARGAGLVLKTVELIEEDAVKSLEQSHGIKEETALKTAPKLFSEDLAIDWSRSLQEVYDFIRGLSPYPGARSSMIPEEGDPLDVKILSGSKEPDPGAISKELRTDNKSFLKVGCSDGWFHINQLQLAGRKALNTENFLRGFTFSGNWKMS